jgi:methyl-accepting chemotaxis protein
MMRSRGVLLAVVAVVLVAGVFVGLGIAFDASFFGVAAIIAAVAFGASMLGLMALLLTLVGTVQELTHSVEQITEQTVPLIGGVNETVAGVNTELARLDGVMASVQHISGTAENIADVVHAAVANPLIKAVAFTTGTGVALRAARKTRQ